MTDRRTDGRMDILITVDVVKKSTAFKFTLQWSDKLKNEWKCIYYTFTPMNSRWFKYKHNRQKNRYQLLLNWFQPYQIPMLKNAD